MAQPPADAPTVTAPTAAQARVARLLERRRHDAWTDASGQIHTEFLHFLRRVEAIFDGTDEAVKGEKS